MQLTVSQEVVLMAGRRSLKSNYTCEMNHGHLFAFRLCQKAVFLNLFIPALVAYKTSEYVSIHVVDIHRATITAFGVSTRI